MGKNICDRYPSAHAVFQEADAALGFSLSALCFNGPADELVKTVNVQPAVLTVSIACLRAASEALGARQLGPAFVAGHSLGEYTALAAAGALAFADAVRLVRERGRLMQAAGEANPGTMLALLGAAEEAAEDFCRATGCVIANVNCPGQIVISGSLEAVARAHEAAKATGMKAVPLKVSGAFHSPLMVSALDGLKEAVAAVPLTAPSVPLVANVTAAPLTDPAAIRQELVAQLDHRVQWQKSVELMSSRGVTTFVEFGPGQVLAGLIKRTSAAGRTFSLGDSKSIEAALPLISPFPRSSPVIPSPSAEGQGEESRGAGSPEAG